ncbi:hypothetical protein [uncultured Acinetobacter sp.]|uniref:hypothetical protein n=1 Tax=uncultured Acinetobacter sp. TaxID=165433 RepID=UPI00258B0EA0|nr:hypothetical protein [uncultured Acinetobacter sp.]
MENSMAKHFLSFSKRFKKPITIFVGLLAIGIVIAQFFITVYDPDFNNHVTNTFCILGTYGLFVYTLWNGNFPPADSISENSSDFSVFMMWSIMILWFLVFIYICIKVMGW